MFTIAATVRRDVAHWLDGFPFAHPDPTLPSVIFNHQVPPFDNQDVRWALALMIDIRAVAMGSYRGAANLAALAVPPTGTASRRLLRADAGMADRLRARHRHAQDQALRPDRRRADRRRWCARNGATHISDRPDQLKRMFGFGWWKQDIEAATELLQKAGFTKDGNQWMKPDGTPFDDPAAGRGRQHPDAGPRRHHHRPAMDEGGHRRQGRRGRADQRPAARRRRLRGGDLLDRSRPGAATPTCLLPRELPLGLHQAARRGAAAAQPAALAGAERLDAIIEAQPHGRLRRPEGGQARRWTT